MSLDSDPRHRDLDLELYLDVDVDLDLPNDQCIDHQAYDVFIRPSTTHLRHSVRLPVKQLLNNSSFILFGCFTGVQPSILPLCCSNIWSLELASCLSIVFFKTFQSSFESLALSFDFSFQVLLKRCAIMTTPRRKCDVAVAVVNKLERTLRDERGTTTMSSVTEVVGNRLMRPNLCCLHYRKWLLHARERKTKTNLMP